MPAAAKDSLSVEDRNKAATVTGRRGSGPCEVLQVHWRGLCLRARSTVVVDLERLMRGCTSSVFVVGARHTWGYAMDATLFVFRTLLEGETHIACQGWQQLTRVCVGFWAIILLTRALDSCGGLSPVHPPPPPPIVVESDGYVSFFVPHV